MSRWSSHRALVLVLGALVAGSVAGPALPDVRRGGRRVGTHPRSGHLDRAGDSRRRLDHRPGSPDDGGPDDGGPDDGRFDDSRPDDGGRDHRAGREQHH